MDRQIYFEKEKKMTAEQIIEIRNKNIFVAQHENGISVAYAEEAEAVFELGTGIGSKQEVIDDIARYPGISAGLVGEAPKGRVAVGPGVNMLGFDITGRVQLLTDIHHRWNEVVAERLAVRGPINKRAQFQGEII